MIVKFPCKKALAKSHQLIQLIQNRFNMTTEIFGYISNVIKLTFEFAYTFRIILQ